MEVLLSALSDDAVAVGAGDDRSDVEELRAAIRAKSAAEERVMRAVARCAERKRFRREGFRSMTEWLSTEFPIGYGTARQWVLLSRALGALRRVRESFAAGALTWQQLKPVARLATPESDEHWARTARALYPSQLWREVDRRTRLRLRDQEAIHASRYLRLGWDRDDPILHVEGRLGREQGEALERAVRERSFEITPDPDADDPSEARRADALVSLATGETSTTVVVHADATVLTRKSRDGVGELEGGGRLHPESVRRLACDARIEWIEERDGRPFGIGRRSPRVPPWLERLVRYRDRGVCRFPGCERKLSLRSHHVRHWADGGATDLENLVTVCETHHRSIHDGGWRIAGDPGGTLRFHDPTGRPLPRGSPAGTAA